MFHMSASEGPKFAETVDEMTERVRKLGPSPLRNGHPADGAERASSKKARGETENGS